MEDKLNFRVIKTMFPVCYIKQTTMLTSEYEKES